MSSSPNSDEKVSRDALGGIVIESRIGPALGRQGFERRYFPGVQLGLAGWERAHSQGNITGHESPHAIRYAPAEVNQWFQRLGIERFIAELRDNVRPDVELLLTTVTYTHRNTLRLKEIHYKVTARWQGHARALFEASIEVQDSRKKPRIHGSVIERTSRTDWSALYQAPSRPSA